MGGYFFVTVGEQYIRCMESNTGRRLFVWGGYALR